MAQHVQVSNSTSSNLTSQKSSVNKKHYTDLLVYSFLKMTMDKNTRISFKSIRKIAEEAGMSTGGVQSALKRLEQAGDIEKTEIKNKKINGYHFNDKSEKFDMFDYTFLKNEVLDNKSKSFMMSIQKHLYIDKEIGIAKTTYNNKQLSEKTGLSERVIAERISELQKMGFMLKRLTTDKNGNNCEALEFNLPKFGQYVLCTLQKHEEDIQNLKEENVNLKMELNKIKSTLKFVLPTIEDAQIIID